MFIEEANLILSLVYPTSNIAPAEDKTLAKAVKHSEILHVNPLGCSECDKAYANVLRA